MISCHVSSAHGKMFLGGSCQPAGKMADSHGGKMWQAGRIARTLGGHWKAHTLAETTENTIRQTNNSGKHVLFISDACFSQQLKRIPHQEINDGMVLL